MTDATKSWWSQAILVGAVIAAVLLLGLWPEPLVRLAEATAIWLGDPEAYIQAVLGG